MSIDLKTVRNIGIAAHIDAGKTTTTERMLYYTGKSHRMGEVDEGTTITDFEAEEQKRGITIYSAAVSCPWNDHTINLIDTPGHVDFTAEVERSLRVLDGMVAVFSAKEGVEAQSETVWRQADKYGVPRICYINKMDRLGADFEAVLADIEKRLPGGKPIILQLPIGEADTFDGVVDLLTMQAYYYTADELGSTFETRDIPADMLDTARAHREKILDVVSETCDELMGKILEEQAVSVEEINAALRKLTISGAAQPVLCGSSLKYVGVQSLLDAICAYLPCPLDMPSFQARDAKKEGKMHEIKCDPAGPLVVYAFKSIAEKPVDLFFVRVYSGTLKPNMRLINTSHGQKENVSKLYRMFAKRREQLDRAEAGDIVAVVGPKHVRTGESLCEAKTQVILESIDFPETVISVSVEPKSSKDKDKLEVALKALERQDPTVSVKIDPETGQTLLSGMGELHLEILIQRIRNDMNVETRVGTPRVSYRETVDKAAEVETRFLRKIGDQEHFAVVKLRVEPTEERSGRSTVEVVSEVPEGRLNPEFIQKVEEGVLGAALSGGLGGYAVIGCKVTILGGEQSDSSSSELAFESAGRNAFYEATKIASPVLLQPVMDVEVVTSDEYFGSIMGDLNTRGASVRDTEMRGPDRVIKADAPLAEMFGYATKLRSLSQGRATFSMTPSHYAPVSRERMRELVG